MRKMNISVLVALALAGPVTCTAAQQQTVLQTGCLVAATGEQLTIAISADINSKTAASVGAGAAKATTITNQACTALSRLVPPS